MTAAVHGICPFARAAPMPRRSQTGGRLGARQRRRAGARGRRQAGRCRRGVRGPAASTARRPGGARHRWQGPAVGGSGLRFRLAAMMAGRQAGGVGRRRRRQAGRHERRHERRRRPGLSRPWRAISPCQLRPHALQSCRQGPQGGPSTHLQAGGLSRGAGPAGGPVGHAVAGSLVRGLSGAWPAQQGFEGAARARASCRPMACCGQSTARRRPPAPHCTQFCRAPTLDHFSQLAAHARGSPAQLRPTACLELRPG